MLRGGEDLPEMPRFGMSLTLPEKLDRVQWYGRGPHESYWDRRTGAAVGRWATAVDSLYWGYARPQENGNRSDTRWVAFTDGSGAGLLAVGLPTLDFSAHFHEIDDFDEGEEKSNRHTIDLVRRDFVTVHLDLRQTGVGGDNSQVPGRLEDLVKLSGVGRKTANVVLGAAFGIPGIVVDTHVSRLSHRFDLSRHEDTGKIERDLTADEVRYLLDGGGLDATERDDQLVIKRIDYYFHSKVASFEFGAPNAYAPRDEWKRQAEEVRRS